MTMPRKLLVDTSVTRYYHCISRCVRRAMLCGEGFEHRKQWIEDRLELLAGAFAVSVCGFSVMDNHLHVLVRLDPEEAKQWSDEEVVRRWIAVYPPKTVKGEAIEINQAWIDHQLKGSTNRDTHKSNGGQARLGKRICASFCVTGFRRFRHVPQRGCAERTRQVKVQREREGLNCNTWKNEGGENGTGSFSVDIGAVDG